MGQFREITVDWFSKLLSAFTGNRDETALTRGLKEAKAGRPDVAVQHYNGILERTADPDLRTRTLYNRALAYTALGNEEQAEADLKLILSVQKASSSLQASARDRLAPNRNGRRFIASPTPTSLLPCAPWPGTLISPCTANQPAEPRKSNRPRNAADGTFMSRPSNFSATEAMHVERAGHRTQFVHL